MCVKVLESMQGGKFVLSIAVNRNTRAIDDLEVFEEALMSLYGILSCNIDRKDTEKILRRVVDYYEED